MEFVETLNDGLSRAYRLSVSDDEINELISQRIEKIRPDIVLPGFRKGKVPPQLLKARHGAELRQEVLTESINEKLTSHITDTGVEPVERPRVVESEGETSAGAFVCDVTYEICPEIPELDFSAIELIRPVCTDHDEEVDERIRRLTIQNAKYHAADPGYSMAVGDAAEVEVVRVREGEPVSGEEPANRRVVIYPDPDSGSIQSLLLGATAGQTLSASRDALKDEPPDSATVEFDETRVTIKSAEQAEIPAPDDSFAEQLGFKTLDEVTALLKETVERETQAVSGEILKRRLYDRLEEMLEIELPPKLLADETGSVLNALRREEQESGQAETAEALEGGDDPLSGEAVKIASRRVKIGLLVRTVAKQQALRDDFSDAELESRLLPVNSTHFQVAYFRRNLENPAFRRRAIGEMIELQATDHFIDLAEVSDETVDRKALYKLYNDLETSA
ncbi:MAG: trigger factor [Rhodobacteraceae bacterium]|nr:trigger factor [Paracoccaceae bacterium]